MGRSQCNHCLKPFLFFAYPALKSDEEVLIDEAVYMFPTPSTGVPISERITKLSPEFAKIYEQSAQAEVAGLDEITGPGYRKALEFLVKAYLIKQKPEKKDLIENLALGLCIDQELDNERLKAVATKAKIAGNDEGHYVKKASYSLDDLKRFISMAMDWINFVLESDEMVDDLRKTDEEREAKRNSKKSKPQTTPK